MSDIYPFVEWAQIYHEQLLAGNRVILADYGGLPVFKINPDIRGDIKNSGNINSQDYFYSTDNLPDSTSAKYFRDQVYDPALKKGICLHFTAGHIMGDLQQLTGVGGYTSVPFLISPAGYIYQLFDPDIGLSWHLGSYIAGSFWHNQIIGIELSNYGRSIVPKDGPINWENGIAIAIRKINEAKGTSRSTDVTASHWEHIETLPAFRGKTRFERFTDAQYNSLRALIKAICRKYPQIKFELIPQNMFELTDARYQFFGTSAFTGPDSEGKYHGGGIDQKEYLLNWRGISSHVNWVGRKSEDPGTTGDWAKWDIGPSLDWNRLMEGRSKCIFPLEIGAGDAPSLRWYANTELKGEGGYFPVGSNAMIHTGVHLFSADGTAAVRSMADGYIAAFRFLPDSSWHQPRNGAISLPENTSFILVRHNLDKPVAGADGTVRHAAFPVYSLYMDLEASPDEIAEVPWAKKLLEQLGRNSEFIPPEKASFNRGTFESDRVITFSKPLLPVKAGETLWYTKGSGGGNHIHWEVFTPEANLFKDMLEKGIGVAKRVEFSEVHGILSLDEINRLFPRRGFGFMHALGLHFLENSVCVCFPDFLRKYFSENDKKYTGKIKTNRPGGSGGQVVVEAQPDRKNDCDVLGIEIQRNRDIITVLPQIRRGRSIWLDTGRLFDNRYSLKMSLQAIEKIRRLAPTARPAGLDGDLELEIDHESFFKEFAGDPKMLRNAWFSSVSPWTKCYCDRLVEEIGENDPELTTEDLGGSILFDPDTECPVYDPIFSGAGAFINPDSPMEYMHPVTFMWLYMLDNEIEF